MKGSRRSFQGRMAFLADVGALLGAALAEERTLPRLARLAVPEFGDLCAIDLVQDDGTLARVAGTHVDAAKEALVTEIRARHGFNPASPAGVPAAVRARRPVLVARATDTDLMTEAQNADQLRILQRLGLRSWMIVPLIGRERVLGAITFAITESSRRYDRTDLALAEVVARQAAVAIESARLRQDAEAARSAAERRTASRTSSSPPCRTSCARRSTRSSAGRSCLGRQRSTRRRSRRALETIERNARVQAQLVEDCSTCRGSSPASCGSTSRRSTADGHRGGVEAVRPAADAKGIRRRTRCLDPTPAR